MLRKKQRAAAPTTAQTSEQQCETYRNGVLTSSKNLKYELGELLFCLELPVGPGLSQIGWELFERRLRRYVDLIQGGQHEY